MKLTFHKVLCWIGFHLIDLEQPRGWQRCWHCKRFVR